MTAPQTTVTAWVAEHEQELIAFRRDLHAHPELGKQEHRTTERIRTALGELGLTPQPFPGGTGVIADIGDTGSTVALRADIDALPIQDTKDVPYRSQHDGICHACGHDAHTAALLGAAGALVEVHRAGGLPGRVRLIFQPAEEQLPGGAVDAVRAGVLDGVRSIHAVHCNPRIDVGRIGLRVGPITAACDKVEVRLRGRGGHTARPQLTADLVYALGEVITRVPGLLSRRVDPRAGLSLVWGAVHAGIAPNAIPGEGYVRGTVRMLSRTAWQDAEKLVCATVEQVVGPTGADVEIVYERGVPPVTNHPDAVEAQRAAVLAVLGEEGLATTEQSMGGEDFGWYLDAAAGALARLGTRPPGLVDAPVDLHQGGFDIDERAIGLGARFLAAAALTALADPA